MTTDLLLLCFRKRLNRVAAQKARERKKKVFEDLEERIRILESENSELRKSCLFYKKQCDSKTAKIQSLEETICQLNKTQVSKCEQEKPIMSAVHPQQKGLATCITILACVLSSLGNMVPQITKATVLSFPTVFLESWMTLGPKLRSPLHQKSDLSRLKLIRLWGQIRKMMMSITLVT